MNPLTYSSGNLDGGPSGIHIQPLVFHTTHVENALPLWYYCIIAIRAQWLDLTDTRVKDWL